jgi:AcrR family transcriptional regulator
MSKADRTEEILKATTELADRHGLAGITREMIANRLGISTGLINSHYGTMQQLRRAVMRRAVQGRNLKLIAEGLVLNDPVARKAPDELRKAAAAAIV